MFTQFGDKTQTVFLKGIENHKLHQEFEVKAAGKVQKGQPVVLQADGTIDAAGATADAHTIIGIAIHNGGPGELVTVGMKAYTIVYASPTQATTAGPVAYNGLNSAHDGLYLDYANTATAGKVVGWSLDPTTAADEIVRIALF